MTDIYVCAHPGGQPTYHNTERAAESKARELVQSNRATIATVYPIHILEEHQ